jgi:hypothetical protein
MHTVLYGARAEGWIMSGRRKANWELARLLSEMAGCIANKVILLRDPLRLAAAPELVSRNGPI